LSDLSQGRNVESSWGWLSAALSHRGTTGSIVSTTKASVAAVTPMITVSMTVIIYLCRRCFTGWSPFFLLLYLLIQAYAPLSQV